MTEVTLETVLKQAGDAMAAAHELKTAVLPKLEKLDGLDKAKIDKLEKTIGDGAQATEDLKGLVAGLQAKQKTIEEEYKALETAYARPGAGGSSEDQRKEMAGARNRLFNKFAKNPSLSHKGTFDEYLEDRAEKDPEAKSFLEMQRKALSVGSDPDGGYTVMPELGGIIVGKIFESSPIRQLADSITIGTDAWEAVTDNDEASSGWVGETQSRTETNTPHLGKIMIPVFERYAEPRATQKIIDDSIVDIESWLSKKVSDLFGRKEATAYVAGTGVLQPRGLLTYTAGTDVNASQIEQVNSGVSADFAYAGLVNIQTALKEEYQANATWLVKRASIAKLMLIVDGQSRPIFNPMFDKNTGLETMLMGRPLRFANDMETAGANSLSAVYGDIRRAYQIVDRIGVRVLRDPYTTKPYIKFYTTKRTGGGVVNFEAIKIQKLA